MRITHGVALLLVGVSMIACNGALGKLFDGPAESVAGVVSDAVGVNRDGTADIDRWRDLAGTLQDAAPALGSIMDEDQVRDFAEGIEAYVSHRIDAAEGQTTTTSTTETVFIALGALLAGASTRERRRAIAEAAKRAVKTPPASPDDATTTTEGD